MSTESLLVYPKEAAAILGVGRAKFYELRKHPEFPKAKKCPPLKRAMYLRSELIKWANSVK